MHPTIASLLARHRGLVTRQLLLDHRVPGALVASLVRRGDLVAVRRGVYTSAEHWASLDPFRGRPRLVARAAVSAMVRGFVLSHDTAMLEHDLTLHVPGPSLTHITRPGFSSAWTRFGIAHHYARFADRQVVEIEGQRVLDAPRTVIDVARHHGFASGVVAADSALRAGVTRAQMMEAYAPMEFWPHIIAAREAVDFADGGAESAAESLARILVHELGLGDIETQFPIRTSRGCFRVDLRVGPHLIEVDGKGKLVPVEAGGLARRPAHELLWDEKRRERSILERPVGLSRLFWTDLFGPARDQAKERLRLDHARIVARYGRQLDPALAAEAIHLRARRPWAS